MIKIIFQSIVFRLPLFLRDKIIVNVFNMPVCTGSYDKYDDIIYGTESYFSKEGLLSELETFREMSAQKEAPILERNITLFAALSIAKEKVKRPIGVLDIGGGGGGRILYVKKYAWRELF